MTSARTGQRNMPVAFSVRNPARLLLLILCGAGRRLCSGRPGGNPVFLVSEFGTPHWWPPAGGHELATARRWAGSKLSLRRCSAALVASTDTATGEIAAHACRVACARAHASASSNVSPPRQPVIRIRRSATVQVTVPRINGWPANWPYRSQTGPSSANANSSRPLHRSTRTSSPPAKRLRVTVPVRPPSPARPENGTTATAAPRRSSSSHTARRATSSRRPARSRAACGPDASRPDGVRHGSPTHALHVGQRRVRHPRATCRHAAGAQRALYEYRCRSRQRVPGAARHSGHHSSSHARRPLTGRPLRRQTQPERCCSRALKLQRRLQPAPRPATSDRPKNAASLSNLDVVVCSIGPVNGDFAIYRTKRRSSGRLSAELEVAHLQGF